MNYEDLQVIWDNQNNGPLYAINPASLHNQVTKDTRTFNREILWRDVREVGIGVGVGILLFVLSAQILFLNDNWLSSFFHLQTSDWDAGLLLVAGSVYFYYAAYRYIGRKQQEKNEQQFDSSLMGDLQKACAQIDYQIRLSKNIHWWGLLPVCFATGLLWIVLLKDKLAKMWEQDVLQASVVLSLVIGLMLVVFVLDYRCKRKPIEAELLPRKRELESLQNKLIHSN